MATLAEAGDRSLSREVFRAIRTHVEMSAVGDSTVEAVGRSSVEAGASPPSRPQTPAAHVRAPQASGSRTRAQRAGAKGELNER
jgi:hypothetical protein